MASPLMSFPSADPVASKAYIDSGNSISMKSIRSSIFWTAPEVLKGASYGHTAAGQEVGSRLHVNKSNVIPYR